MSTFSMRQSAAGTTSHLAAAALFALAAGSLQAREDPRRGLHFDSPGVLDLAERTQAIENGSAVPATLLGAADAKAILTAAALDEARPALRFSDDQYACDPPSRACSEAGERALVDAAGSTVKREGKRLTVVPSAGAPAIFLDWTMATTKSADGDLGTHVYLGRLAGSGYHRTEVQFGHDAPGSFLVNPGNGKIAFVHNGSDIAVPAPDGLRLLTFNSMNPPLSLRVAALDASGPRLALTCTAKSDSPATARFKGWHDASSFDLALLPAGERGEEILALRLQHDAQGWHVASVDPGRVATIAFACRQPSS
jgi:hypothetical protein